MNIQSIAQTPSYTQTPIYVTHITREIKELLNQLYISLKSENGIITIELIVPDHLKNHPINLHLIHPQIQNSSLPIELKQFNNQIDDCSVPTKLNQSDQPPDSLNVQQHIVPNSLRLPDVQTNVSDLLDKYMKMCKSHDFRPTKKLFCESFCEQKGVLMRYGSMRINPLFKELWIDAIKRNRLRQ